MNDPDEPGELSQSMCDSNSVVNVGIYVTALATR